MQPKKARGLPAVNQARDDRRAIRGKYTPQFVMGAGALVVCSLIGYKLISTRDLNIAKEKLVGERDAAIKTVGAEWFPLRDKIESTIVADSREYAGDSMDPGLAQWGFRGQPGIYLRLRVADAKDAASIRKLAPNAKKDAFAGCLLKEPNERAARGEADAGAFSEQPWNLAQAYKASHVLEDSWADEMREAPDLLHLRVFEQQYEKALKDELPLAARIVRGAQFFLLALDEDVPEAATVAGGGAITEEALQQVPHPTRVFLVDLRTGREMARLRRSGDARVIPAGERAIADPETRAAMQRQANNCNLAQQVDAALMPPTPAPASSTK